MSKKRQYAKQAIDDALNFIKNNEGSIRQAAKKFDVPRSSLQFKIKNPDTKFKSGPDPVLTEAEENSLCNFIIQMAKRGFPRKKEDIQLCVQDFLRENPRPNPFRDGKPGDVWFKAFLKRHPNISIRTSEGVTNASACVLETNIRKWFQEIHQYIDDEGLEKAIRDPARVFNADETGFNICPKTGKVLAEKGCKNVYQIEKASAKENITVLFTFSAAGQVCNPMIIYPYKRIPDRVSMSVPSGWGIGRSDSGWMTADVFYDYIANCFYKQLIDDNITFPVILFVDGHKTHLTIQVSELCRSKGIHLIALYPNATRILQPADVAAFRPIKVGWKKALREWYAANNYEKSLTKETFAPLLKTVVDSFAKKDTLINGFRVTGLHPFEPNNVDYSKCIPSEKQPENLTFETSINHEVNTVLTYSDFCDIVGESVLAKCYTATTSSIQDENFNAIYKLWQKFRDCSYSIHIPNWSNEAMNERYQPVIENLSENDPTLIEDCDKLESDGSRIILDERTGEIIDTHTKGEDDEGRKEIKENEQCINLQPPMDPTPELEAQISENSVRNFSPQPSTSKQIDPYKKIQIISNVSMTEFLKKNLPLSPKRQGRRQSERLPFALTSDQYVGMIKAKQLQKEEQEAAKLERKRLRENKKIEKENSGPKKKPKKCIDEAEKGKTKRLKGQSSQTKDRQSEIQTNRHISIVCCDVCLSPITKRIVACSQCNKKFHFNCIPSSHRIHIPYDDDDDDAFLCHLCYRVSNSDSSDSANDIFDLIRQQRDY